MRGVLLGLGLLSAVALAGPSKSAKCETRDKACLSARAIASNGSPLARLLTPTGSTVSMSGVTFSRSGPGAACTASDGGVSFPADGQPCVNSTGLHMRPQIADLLTYSSDFTQAAWNKNSGSITVTADSTTAPDGTTTADTLTIASTTNAYAIQTVTANGGGYAASAYVRTASGTQAVLFRLLDSTATTTLCQASGTATTTWQRLSCTVANTTTGHAIGPAIFPGGGSPSVGNASVWWGVQTLSSATSLDLCPSGASPATCNAETATVPKPSGMSLTEGCARFTIVPSWTGTNPTGTTRIILSANGSATARIGFIPASQSMAASDGTHAPSIATTFTAGSARDYLATWSATSGKLTIEDLTSATGASATGFTSLGAFATTLSIGNENGGAQPAVGISNLVLGSGVNACN